MMHGQRNIKTWSKDGAPPIGKDV